MFSRLAITLAKPAAKPAALSAPSAFGIRFLSQQAAPVGSTGRKIGFKGVRATAPVASAPATLTIRVCSLFYDPS